MRERTSERELKGEKANEREREKGREIDESTSFSLRCHYKKGLKPFIGFLNQMIHESHKWNS